MRIRRVSSDCPERLTWTASPNTCANKTATRMLMFRWRLIRFSILRFPVSGFERRPGMPQSIMRFSGLADQKLETRNVKLLNRDFSQQLKVAEHLAGAEHHAAERIVRNRNRETSFFPNALIQI